MPVEDLLLHLRAIGIAVQLVVGRLLDAVVSGPGFLEDVVEDPGIDLPRAFHRRPFHGLGYVAQLLLQPSQRLFEEADAFIKTGDGAPEPPRRAGHEDTTARETLRAHRARGGICSSCRVA